MQNFDQDTLARMMESYKQQMLSYYKIGKDKNPGYEELAIPAMAVVPQTEPIRPDGNKTEQTASEQAVREYEMENPYNGYLKIQTYTARRAMPVSNASVTVTKLLSDGRHEFATTKTDQSGQTEVVALPAPSKDLSEAPNQGKTAPFASYDIKIEHPNYVTIENFDVPVFQDVVSIQPADMVPKTPFVRGTESEKIYEHEPSDL